MNRLLTVVFCSILMCAFKCMANNDNAQPLHKYAEACVVMKNAIASKDKEKLISAMEAMDELEIDRGEHVTATSLSNKPKRPEVIFLPEYADYLLLHDFEIASLDDASMLRGSSSATDVFALTNRCAANDEVQYELEGNDDMVMFLLSASDNMPEVKIYIGSDETPASIASEDRDGVRWWRWNQGEQDKFRLVVTNQGNSDVDFVIGLN